MIETKEPSNEELLQGRTLTVYWYLLTHGESGIREIQRSLEISSPSTVSYHINKLLEAGIITKSSNEKFIIVEPVKTGILGMYIKIGTRMIPRLLFYLTFFTIGTVLYLLLMINRGNFQIYTEDVIFLFYSVSGICIFLYESFRIWKMKPL